MGASDVGRAGGCHGVGPPGRAGDAASGWIGADRDPTRFAVHGLRLTGDPPVLTRDPVMLARDPVVLIGDTTLLTGGRSIDRGGFGIAGFVVFPDRRLG